MTQPTGEVDAAKALRHRRAGRFGALVVFAAAGVLFVTSAITAGGRDIRGGAGDLPELVNNEQGRVAQRTEAVATLRDEVDALAASGGDPRVRALQKQVSELAPAAGTRAVTGPGVTVILDDAPRGAAAGTDLDPDLLLVHQEDLQAVVNAMWAGGAEAVSLMDQPIISTSAVRCVGNTLRLQGQVYAPPYRVSAIGDPDRLAASLEAEPDIAAYRELASLGLGWEMRRPEQVEVPAWSGSLELRYAQPVTA